MAVRQYIGARYVPKFYEGSNGSQWDSGVQYEPLTLVQYLTNTYCSKKTVPSTVGAPNLNPDYWANVGMIGDLANRVSEVESDLSAAELDIDNLQTEVGRVVDRKFVFISDSYGNFPTTLTSWIPKIAQELGLEAGDYYANPKNGAGFYVEGNNSFLAALQELTIEDKDSITDIVLAGGANDAGNTYQDYSVLRTNIANYISYCKTNYPNARVWIGYIANVVIGGSQSDSYSYFSQQAVMEAYKKAGGALYLNGSELPMHRKSWFDNGVHPNEYISGEIAHTIANCLRGCGDDFVWYPDDITATGYDGVTINSLESAIIGNADIYGGVTNCNLTTASFAKSGGISMTTNQWHKVATYTSLAFFANAGVVFETNCEVMIDGTAGVHIQPFNVKFEQGNIYLMPKYIDGGTYPTQVFNVVTIANKELTVPTVRM